MEITLTDSEIKAKYGQVYKLEIEVSDTDIAIAYLRQPSREIMSAMFAKMSTDPLMANEILLRGIIIKEISDNRILENDQLFMSACTSLDQIIVLKKSTLMKL